MRAPGGLRSQLLQGGWVARALAATAGRAALARALPLYLAVGIVSAVLFGGNGMDAATVTERARAEPGFRLALFGSWVLATLPAALAWLGTPATFFLRALPLSRASLFAVLAAGLLAMHSPWLVLWLRGAGFSAAAWAFFAAAALQTSSSAGISKWRDVASLALSVAAIALGPGFVTAGLAGGLFARSLAIAWSRAPERSANGRGWVTSRGPSSAAFSALVAAGARGHAPVAFRSLLLTLAAAWLATVGLSRDLALGPSSMTLCLLSWVPSAIFAAASASKPLLQIERSLSWLARCTGAPARVQAAPELVLLSLTALLGALFAILVGAAAHLSAADAARLFAASVTAGAVTGGVTGSTARRLLRDDGRDAGRLVLASLGSLTAWIVALLELGGRALPLMALLSAAWMTWERLRWGARRQGAC